MVASHLLGIAAEQNVRAAAGHVGGHGDRAFAPGLRNDARFALMLLGVQHLMRDAAFLQQFGDGFGLFDGDGAHEHGLAPFVILADAVGKRVVFLQDAVDDGLKFFFLRAVHDVRRLDADQLAVGGNDRDVQIVNLAELRRFRFRCTGHAREFLVHAEIILERNRRERLIFALDLHAFFGFHGLVQAVGPAATGHLAAREFIDDDDFTVFYDVIHVVLVERMGAQRLIDMVHDVDVRRIGHVGEGEEAFALGKPLFGERRGAVLLVKRIVDVLNQFRNNLVDLGVFVGGLFRRPGNDQRGARLVDEDGVDFVDDGELVSPLHALRQVVLHIVAQVVKAEFVVGAVRDVCAIRRPALVVVEIVHDHAHAQS